jgi:hypothetical protein
MYLVRRNLIVTVESLIRELKFFKEEEAVEKGIQIYCDVTHHSCLVRVAWVSNSERFGEAERFASVHSSSDSSGNGCWQS